MFCPFCGFEAFTIPEGTATVVFQNRFVDCRKCGSGIMFSLISKDGHKVATVQAWSKPARGPDLGPVQKSEAFSLGPYISGVAYRGAGVEIRNCTVGNTLFAGIKTTESTPQPEQPESWRDRKPLL